MRGFFCAPPAARLLTRESKLFYQNCHPGVERIAQALEGMRELRNGPPRGHLRISSTPGFGRKIVAPLLRGFRTRYPDIAFELLLNDRPADFISDRVDVGFHDGRMEDSEAAEKQLIPMPMIVCASPLYERRHNLPRQVEELVQHRCVDFRSASGRVSDCEVKVDGLIQKHSTARASLNCRPIRSAIYCGKSV